MRRVFRKIKQELFHSDGSVQSRSMSLALGVGLAFSPFVGFHVFVVIFLAKFCRLNGMLMLCGTLIHNPWTMVPIHFLGLITGDLFLFNRPSSVDAFNALPWSEFGLLSWFKAEFWESAIPLFQQMLVPFIIGSVFWSFVTGFVTYFLSTKVLKPKLQPKGVS